MGNGDPERRRHYGWGGASTWGGTEDIGNDGAVESPMVRQRWGKAVEKRERRNGNEHGGVGI